MTTGFLFPNIDKLLELAKISANSPLPQATAQNPQLFYNMIYVLNQILDKVPPEALVENSKLQELIAERPDLVLSVLEELNRLVDKLPFESITDSGALQELGAAVLEIVDETFEKKYGTMTERIEELEQKLKEHEKELGELKTAIEADPVE